MAMLVSSSRNEMLCDIVKAQLIPEFKYGFLARYADTLYTGKYLENYKGPTPTCMYITTGDTDMYRRDSDGRLVRVYDTNTAGPATHRFKLLTLQSEIKRMFGDIPVIYCDHYGINLHVANPPPTLEEEDAAELAQQDCEVVFNAANDQIYEINDQTDVYTPRFSDLTTITVGTNPHRFHHYGFLDPYDGYTVSGLHISVLISALKTAFKINQEMGIHD